MKGVFSIPYFNITEPIELWYDAVNDRQVISYYNGMDITYTIQVSMAKVNIYFFYLF